jgi:hypothetical protein
LHANLLRFNKKGTSSKYLQITIKQKKNNVLVKANMECQRKKKTRKNCLAKVKKNIKCEKKICANHEKTCENHGRLVKLEHIKGIIMHTLRH